MSDFILNLKSISKSFFNNRVLNNVEFSLKRGEVHALLGENGTGKTTLMNILSGSTTVDSGELYLNDEIVKLKNHCFDTKGKIAFIHQELTLINDLTVYENLFLGKEIKKRSFLNKQSMLKKAEEIISLMGVTIDCSILVGELNASYKQIIEIGRALLFNSNVIIMDEPTASLSEKEINNVFKIINSLKNKGVSFIFISHKLDEVLKICDRYTVMRDGKTVITDEIDQNTTSDIIASYMIGKKINKNELYRKHNISEIILETKSLTVENEFYNVNLKLKKGEILGVTGLLGDGRSELFETIYGFKNKYKGKIYISGKLHKMHSTSLAQKLGISYVPKNRKENGIIHDLSVGQNMSLSVLNKLKKRLFISKDKEITLNKNYIHSLNIKLNNLNDKIDSLSGGNQQKVLIAKALASNPLIVILDNPTQGVDIGAKFEIYNIIFELAKQGVSFIILSNEDSEVLMLCDRIYVMFSGKIASEFSREEATEEKILLAATGSYKQTKEGKTDE